MNFFKKNFSIVYQSSKDYFLTLSLFFSFSLLNYFLLTRTTSWERFLTDNQPFFVFLTIVLSIINNLLIAVVLTFFVYILDKKKSTSISEKTNFGIGLFLSLLSVGCAVCGGFLLPLFGVAASLTAFPFQGIEIKLLSIFILLITFWQLNSLISGRLKKTTFKSSFGYLMVGLSVLLIVYLIPRLPWKWRQNSFGGLKKETDFSSSNKIRENLFDQINPEKGYEINASYGDLGPKLIASGVIDLEKFKQVYQQNGQPLTNEQLEILTKGSNKKIRITRENSYFLLNFFWAVGLANKSKILTEGEITQYGKDQIGNFASTGGWSLSKTQPMDYYANFNLISLTDEQEKLVEKVSVNIYRPCCNNSTAFPDCNHGMALLAVLQLLAKNGATENQLYEAGKYFNAFWFPGNYYDLALYFKNKEGKSFQEIPGQIILGKDYSSASGWQRIKQWLADKGLIEKPPKQGGGCGV